MHTSNKLILAIFDISGIQPYIFATSRLRENVGASRIVGLALRELLPDVLVAVHGENDGIVHTDWELQASLGEDESSIGIIDTFRILHDDQVMAEVIYNGGGSAVVAFRDAIYYQKVRIALAKRLIETSYTLTLTTAAIETACHNYSADRTELAKKLDEVKSNLLRQRPIGALPISEQEGYTGLPVTQRYSGEDVSTLQWLKREAFGREASELFALPAALRDKFRWAFEMEELVQNPGDSDNSYVAVVHIDGNGIGRQLQDKIKDLNQTGELTQESYEKAVVKMRELSQAISTGYRNIFSTLLEEVVLHQFQSSTSQAEKNSEASNDKLVIPLRPLIMDGDDLTFICTGSWGVPFAAEFLRRLEQASQNVTQDKLSLSACAGVALVHSHFPFNIAYNIAEECCQLAKMKRVREPQKVGYLDFHLVRGSYVQGLDEIRESLIRKAGAQLLNRPYRIQASDNPRTIDSYEYLRLTIASLPEKVEEEAGRWPRSRIKALHEAYTVGPDAVRTLLEEYKSRSYEFSSLELDPNSDSNHLEQNSIYDALELIDLFERRLLPDEGIMSEDVRR